MRIASFLFVVLFRFFHLFLIIGSSYKCIHLYFFHTHPYNSLKMTDGNEVFTTFLLLAVGLVVGEIAVRSQTIHALRTDHRAQLRRINRIAGLAAKGELVDDLLLAVTAELIDTLRLRDAYFERRLIAIALADQVGAVLGRKAA